MIKHFGDDPKRPAEQNREVIRPKYSPTEEIFISNCMMRISDGLERRESNHPLFDGMTYTQWYDENQRLGKNLIKPKKNPQDTVYQTGITYDKIKSLRASINGLDFGPEITAYDEKQMIVRQFGETMEDQMLKSEQLENDAEKKMLRQDELLVQGTVFVEERMCPKFSVNRRRKGGGKFDGKVSGVEYHTSVRLDEKIPERHIIKGKSVLLGDLTKYNIKGQPWIATIEEVDYIDTARKFGHYERWQYVPKDFSPSQYRPSSYDSIDESVNQIYSPWDNLSTLNGKCLIVRIQDVPNDRFTIFINGVLMTPMDLSLTEVLGYKGQYSISQQNLDPLAHDFAYGNSLPRMIKFKVAALDEAIRLSVLKNQQSYKPPVINASGRVLSNRIFDAGKINNGADLKGKIIPLLENQQLGVTNSEFAMIKEFKTQINESSVSPVFTGQLSEGSNTATEIVEVQKQAKIVLGLTEFACEMLEWKLSWLRFQNILANGLQHQYEYKESEGIISRIKKYKTLSVERDIGGEGPGVRMSVPTEEEMPTSKEVYDAEEQLSKKNGKPTRLLFFNPKEIKSSKYTWLITIRSRPKKSSELGQLKLENEITKAINIFGPENVNLEHYKEEFARVHNRDPKKIFNSSMPNVNPMNPLAPQKESNRSQQPSPIKPASIQKTVNNQIQASPQ